ncbi:putative glycine-rich cell wall structural protein 1 [Gossypium arboreum]|uniref:putative glycine-rich cell wall structural protein 1 n=1 Tax=Gossypium arboreum TaxID=29729 RepID=UPI0022F18FE4|nr:putative glycine-rich cell wall structural protein 1 [Gossypium arboreum]
MKLFNTIIVVVLFLVLLLAKANGSVAIPGDNARGGVGGGSHIGSGTSRDGDDYGGQPSEGDNDNGDCDDGGDSGARNGYSRGSKGGRGGGDGGSGGGGGQGYGGSYGYEGGGDNRGGEGSGGSNGGSSRGCFGWGAQHGHGRAGSGGVLRDKEGVARALFSGSVDANDADVVEAGAVKAALEAMTPWSLQAIFAGIDRDMLKAGNVVFSVENKEGN